MAVSVSHLKRVACSTQLMYRTPQSKKVLDCAVDANLLSAVRHNNSADALAMLQQNANPDGVYGGCVPIIEALSNQAYDCLEHLIDAKADISCRGRGCAGAGVGIALTLAVGTDSARPIYAIAASLGYYPGTSLGLDPLGGELLTSAVRNDRLTSVRTLLELGAVPNWECLFAAVHHQNLECLTVLLCAGAPIDGRNFKGDTVIMSAAALGHISCVRLLISAGAEISTVSYCGWDALDHALVYARIGSASALLDAGVVMHRDAGNHRELAEMSGSSECVQMVGQAWRAEVLPYLPDASHHIQGCMGLPTAVAFALVQWL